MFPSQFLSTPRLGGRDLLACVPYCCAAFDWSEENFDHVYKTAWWPASVPVLILAGGEDRIVWQGGWNQARFRRPNMISRTVREGGHFPWIDR